MSVRTKAIFDISDPLLFKQQLLSWASCCEEVVWLDSNAYPDTYRQYDAVLAVEAFTAIKTDTQNAFEKLKEYQQTTADWIFGYLSYDLKNDTEYLKSKNSDGLHFPELYFFQPQKLFLLKGNKLEVQYLRMVDDEIELDFTEINEIVIAEKGTENQQKSSNIQSRLSKEAYLEKVETMLKHIHRGDIYEANFCQEFYVEDVDLNPIKVFDQLNAISNPPFASFLKLEDYYAMCTSPERYLQKKGNHVISQPIKGTAARDSDPGIDASTAQKLSEDDKERSENIMIADLVRNDLSKTASKGSVKVEELCKVYSFKQVHQLISTISAEISEEIPAVEVLKTTFPMGSMTGAPKISAMKIIEDLEETKRGLYSGAIGYFTPEADFDFNVVIRSILYNAERKYASFSVGGAITAQSNPEKEYNECMVKAKAMRQVLESQS
ncbi:anthranilate synthase component I family protein [Zunongwangia sp. HRR-M8]|uniref:anthranilate synthase component I family protein n=1 Tax=Zunongwangia sp. HRR-M8 TaxID=3015170 RepID=UPI0022DCF4C6|nr:anthranilate synthase component I family protein [Zunongwangia sp. HRR-M8]WBL21303.1 anthranilate synthase component I family protein [Zunongwangia sp. HRR-M8]